METATATDKATVQVVEGISQETGEVLGPDGEVLKVTGPTEADTEVDYEMLASKVIGVLHEVLRAGDLIAMLLVNPRIKVGLEEALRALPDEAVHPDPNIAQGIKHKLPMQEDSDIPLVQVITGSDIEKRFLEAHFGPTENGGTGLLPRMESFLSQQPYPIRITTEWLRGRYLDEVAERVGPKIVRVGSAPPNMAKIRM